jgi:hypothetical protein
MFNTTGYSGKVVKIKGKQVTFESGGTHYISNFSFAISVGDVIMIDSHGSIWKKV